VIKEDNMMLSCVELDDDQFSEDLSASVKREAVLNHAL